MEYQKAKYERIMCCPECSHSENNDEGKDMPDPWDFTRRTDEKGTEYYECSCGCKFVE